MEPVLFDQTPTIVDEKAALFPKSPVVFEGTSTDTDEFTIPPNILIGEDSLETSLDPYEAQVATIFEKEKENFHALVDFKVKSELVAQLFKSHPEGIAKGSINLTEVQSLVATLVAHDRDINNEHAQTMDNKIIPQARNRFEVPITPTQGVTPYLEKDVPILEAREDAYVLMTNYLHEYGSVSQDEYRDRTEAIVARLLPEARQEAINILKEQRELLLAQAKEADKKIGALEQELGIAKAETEGRDIEMYDKEMEAHLAEVDHLTDEAKKLAA